MIKYYVSVYYIAFITFCLLLSVLKAEEINHFYLHMELYAVVFLDKIIFCMSFIIILPVDLVYFLKVLIMSSTENI
jgi:hypothetical protein